MESRLRRDLRPHAARGPARARTPQVRAALTPPPADPAPTRPLLRFTRHGIPALAVLAGIVAMCFGTDTSLIGGGGLIGAGIAAWLVSWLYRLGVSGDAAREREARARAQFERTGRWPEG